MLSEEQRVCIVLRNVEGLTYEEIANTLGIDINSVRSRLKRARDKMLEIRKEVMGNEL
jgi:RNA polymerase sigma-70 factor (ECF subfamily)